MKFETAEDIGREPHGSSEDPDILDFSANTNPRVPRGVESVYRDAFEDSQSYQAEPPSEFRTAAAEYVGCRPEQVIPTPGGLAALRRTLALAVDDGDSVLVPTPSFGEYAREVRLHGGDPTFVPEDSILDADPTDHALALVCTPNNPTGRSYNRETLEEFVARCRDEETLVLVDEAFLGFTERESLAGTDGVVVARSLTKLFGLPGIRVGFAVGTGEWREALANARRPWNVSQPALAVGAFCMTQDEFIAETRERVRAERTRLQNRLSEQFTVYRSDAPFLLFDVGDRAVPTVVSEAHNEGIALRDATTFRGLNSHIRVAVRLPEANDRLLAVLTD
jgi:L-threonine-O-3-phosphate decarboxylase